MIEKKDYPKWDQSRAYFRYFDPVEKTGVAWIAFWISS
jgi:hypothetical protein